MRRFGSTEKTCEQQSPNSSALFGQANEGNAEYLTVFRRKMLIGE